MIVPGAASKTSLAPRVSLLALGLGMLALTVACSGETSPDHEPAARAKEAPASATTSSATVADTTEPRATDSPPTTPWSEAFANWTPRLEQAAPDDQAVGAEFRRWIADLAADLHTRAKSADAPEFFVDATTLGRACGLAEQVFASSPLPLDDLAGWLTCVPDSGPSAMAAYHAYLLAYICVSRGAYDRALISLMEIERRFPREPYLLEDRWNILAQVHRELGSRREAQKVVGRLLDRLHARGRHPSADYARALAVRADIAVELGQVDRALVDMDAARKMSLAIDDHDLEFEIYMSMLDALLAQGRSDRILGMTESLAGRSATEAAQVQVSRGSALLHLGRGDHSYLAKAAETLDAALACETLPAEFRAFAINRRVEVSLAAGELAEARQFVLRHTQFRAGLLDRFQRDSATASHFDLVSLLSELEVAEPSDAIETQLELHRSAFQSLLRSWRALDLDAEGVGRMHLGWPNRLITNFVRLGLAAAPGRVGETHAAEVMLQAHAAFGLAGAIPGSTPSLAQLQTDLMPNQGILAIQASPTTSLAIWITKSKLASFELLGSQRVEALARELNRGLDEVGAGIEAVESTLSALAAAALPTELRGEVEQVRHLTIAGADLLGNLPFEVLPHSAGGSLGEHIAIDRTTSLIAWHRLRARSGQLRDAVFVGSLSPASRHRAIDSQGSGAVPADYSRLVLAAWPRHSARVLVDQAATVDAFREAATRPGRFLQVLGHGVWDADSEVGAVIAVTPSRSHPDGIISENEVESLTACSPVIMISSCRIGATKQRIGDSDLNSLAGAFLRRGAKAVIQSRFPLKVGLHSEFAGRVHSQLAAGVTVADAVRQARADLARHSRSPDVLREIAIEVIGNGH